MIQKIWFFLLSALCLVAAPWDLDPESKELLNAQIEARHQQRISESAAQGIHYLIDYDNTRLNFYSESCPYCQSHVGDTSQQLEEKLEQAGFQKRLINTIDQRKAHCYGASFFFVKYLLTHPQVNSHSCTQILSKVLNDPNFKQVVHSFAVNQHTDYFLKDPSAPLELDPSAMKAFIQVLVEQAPLDYYFLPITKSASASFDKTAIYNTLNNLQDKLLVIGYTKPSGVNHCIAISANSKKCFVFDSTLGLFHFSDLETLSWTTGRVLNGSHFRWLVSFPFADDFSNTL